MNTYPTLPTQYGSEHPHRMAIDVRIATNGAARTRVLHDRRRREFPLVHPNMTTAQRDTLLAFWDANVGTEFIYSRVRDGVTENYTAVFTGEPVETYAKGGRYTYRVALREA